MGPETWGPPMWSRFHRYAAKYTPSKKSEARLWYRRFMYALPCNQCADKYKALLECTMPLTSEHLASREALFEWTFHFHNAVNMLLHKPLFEFYQAKAMYNL